MRKVCLLLAGLVMGGPVHAAGVDISVSDQTANFVFLLDSSSLGYGGADIGIGGFYNENKDWVATGNLLVTSNPGSGNPWQIGVGTKAYYADLDIDESASAIALGGVLRYVIPSETPMGVAFEGYTAPSVTSFGDTERFHEAMARFEVEVVPSTRGYVGYRWMETRLEDIGKYRLDDEFHIGIRVFF
jgi:hypothetical protein